MPELLLVKQFSLLKNTCICHWCRNENHFCTHSWLLLYSWNVVWCKTWQHVDTVRMLDSRPQHWQNPKFMSPFINCCTRL